MEEEDAEEKEGKEEEAALGLGKSWSRTLCGRGVEEEKKEEKKEDSLLESIIKEEPPIAHQDKATIDQTLDRFGWSTPSLEREEA